MIRAVAVSLAFCAGASCASAKMPAVSKSDSTEVRAGSAARSTTLITVEEIDRSGARDAYDAVQKLRPAWLRKRAPSSNKPVPDVALYVNWQRYGDAPSLRHFRPSAIKEVRYLSPAEATQRFGDGHQSGAILVLSR